MEKNEMVCGVRPVIEALQAGRDIERLLIRRDAGGDGIREIKELARSRDLHWQPVPAEKLDRMTRTEHQGVIALLCQVEEQDLDAVIAAVYERGLVPLVIALDGVTDVRNMGAIARSAECFGAHALVVPRQGSARLGSDAVKSSAGALLRLPVCRVKDLKDTLRGLQERGLHVVACTEKAERSVTTHRASVPTVLVMGDEGAGISEPVLRVADELLRIPMAGSIGSLNVSVAAGIALFALTADPKG
jgi:23S rRNA (guanosine2251-2'-O)-methyltransferase